MLNPDTTNADAQGMQWLSETFSVIDPGKDIDIVALAPSEPLEPSPSTVSIGPGFGLGGDCEFLGFPFAAPWRMTFNGKTFWMPFMKHCTISAESDDKVIFLDGINNKGFSGGPVIFQTGLQQRIIGVISGYFAEPEQVMAIVPAQNTKEPNKVTLQPKEPPEIVNVNSGFFVAYDISYAVDAIRKNPIGPLRHGN
jgi:hypothetical protein